MNFYLKIEGKLAPKPLAFIQSVLGYYNNYKLDESKVLDSIASKIDGAGLRGIKAGRAGSHVWIHNKAGERIAMIFNNPPNTKF